jgi:hypothetical protein
VRVSGALKTAGVPSTIEFAHLRLGFVAIFPLRPAMNLLRCLVLCFAGASLLVFSDVSLAQDDLRLPDTVQFNRDIRPILSNNCYACHGPDENQRQADLRLDTEEGAQAVLEPGVPAASLLVERIASDDPSLRMPPADTNKSLTPRQIALLTKWIEQGAEWQKHWSLIPPTRPAVPEVALDAPRRNPIDAFIQRRLQIEELEPAPESDRRTLLRRLSFDLTGLPPTPEEVEAFINDDSPEAYEHAVDRLLALQHFGERMAIHWLDLVRYADTNGIHGDNPREHSLYRDYVIDAFNNNKPFDQFTREQLAGDLLPHATRETRIASGYNRLNMTTREGGAQAKEYLAKYSADRVRNVSSVWLAATMGCCECHDHKFDPFPTRDFYALAAFFADIQETAVGVQQPTPMPTAEQEAELTKLESAMTPLRETLQRQTPELDAGLVKWEASLGSQKTPWSPLRPVEAKSKNGATLTVLDDGVIRAEGENPESDTYTLTFETEDQAFTALRLEVLPDDSLPAKGPGRAGNGNFVLDEFAAKVDGKPVAWSAITATHSQDNWPVEASTDGKPKTGWAILPQVGKENHAVYEAKADLGAAGVKSSLVVTMTQNYGGMHTLGKFRISVATTPRPVRAGDGVPPEIAEILKVPTAERSDEQRKKLAAHYRTFAPELAPVREELAKLEEQKKQLEAAFPKLLISVSVPPREIRVLPRGNWLDDSGPVVEPAAPEVLEGIDTGDRRATRLDLAEWLVQLDHPLTSRVFVNRVWQLMFGQGLVTTLDDFGAQGDWPSHPELLDWLAMEFVESGWDVKELVKLITMSHTYRQSSAASPELRERDPANELLARQGRFRLPAEMVRDNALAVSGLLVPKIGGPSVKPYQPAGYWKHLNFPTREWQHDQGESLYRRGLYTFWCRTFLHPSMLAFDAPTREECAVARNQSNTPQQALVLLNDPIYVETSRSLAARIMREGGETPESRIAFAFHETLQREPRSDEAAILLPLYAKHLAHYEADPAAAAKLLDVGESPADLAGPELAAWTSIARVILNLHETIMRY